jgi:hypothetical protein
VKAARWVWGKGVEKGPHSVAPRRLPIPQELSRQYPNAVSPLPGRNTTCFACTSHARARARRDGTCAGRGTASCSLSQRPVSARGTASAKARSLHTSRCTASAGTGISARTVHRWLRNGTFPEARRRRRRPSLMDPYERYVRAWWQEGNRNGSQLYRELVSRGYKGSSKAMYNYLATLRTPQVRSSKSTPSRSRERKSIPWVPAPLENFSAQRAT